MDVRLPGEQDIINYVSNLAGVSPIAKINLVDNNFQLPREWKRNIGLNPSLPNNYNLSFDATYTKLLESIFFKSINRQDNTGNFDGADAKAYFLKNW